MFGAGDEVLHADGRPAKPQRRFPEVDHAGSREFAAAPEDGLHRPVSGAPPERDDGCRGDPRCADRSRPPGQGPLHRIVLVPGQPDRRGAMGLPRAEPGPVRHRAAPVLDPGPRYRGGRAPDRAALWHGNPGVQPAVRWLADRPVAQGRPRHARVSCTPGCPLRHEHTGEPAQAGCSRRPCAAGREVRNDDDRTRTGMGDQPSRRHLLPAARGAGVQRRARHRDPSLVTDRRHHLLPRGRAHQHPGRPGHRQDRRVPLQEPRAGHAALAPAGGTFGHPEVNQAPPHRGELRRVRLRAHHGRGRGHRRARYRQARRPRAGRHHLESFGRQIPEA